MNRIPAADRTISVLEIERRNGAMHFRGHWRDLLASKLVTNDMLPAAPEHARCGFRATAGERWSVTRLAELDTYELRIDARPSPSLHPPAAPPAPVHPAGHPPRITATVEMPAADVVRIVHEYTRLGVGALELLEGLLVRATDSDAVTALGQTIAHLKQVYTGLERRHCGTLCVVSPH